MKNSNGTSWNHRQSIKELIRHVLFRTGMFGLLDVVRRRKGLVTEHLKTEDRQSRFAQIYELGVWRHHEDQEAASGVGSELASTEPLRANLPALLSKLEVSSLTDVGCGDWTWMSKLDLPCDYLGLDIVDTVIDRNLAAFAKPGVQFRQLDAVAEPLPDCDVVLCREVVFHLSFADGLKLIDNIKRHSKWLIMTSDSTIWFNSDIPSGDFRMLNLHRRPFQFPTPKHVLQDDGLVAGRSLGVWRTDAL